MKSQYIGIALLCVVIVVGVIVLGKGNSSTTPAVLDTVTSTDGVMEKDGAMQMEAMMKAYANGMRKEDSGARMKDDSMMSTHGSYEAYTPEKVSRAADGNVVLFFHAPWCPTCRSADADITKNTATIPAGLSILKTDYDTYDELKKKYGVTYQHTFVQVDAAGNLIKKWSGGDYSDILANVQ